jgi:hypothetical protein
MTWEIHDGEFGVAMIRPQEQGFPFLDGGPSLALECFRFDSSPVIAATN